jgi:hypothetical protein
VPQQVLAGADPPMLGKSATRTAAMAIKVVVRIRCDIRLTIIAMFVSG